MRGYSAVTHTNNMIIVRSDTGQVVGCGGVYDEEKYNRRRVYLCGIPRSRQHLFELRRVSEEDCDWILRSSWKKLRLTSGHLKRMPLIWMPQGTDKEIDAL